VSTNKAFMSNIKGFLMSSSYLERPRLNKLLDIAADFPLVVVCAGSGYGKTRTVYSFLQGYDAYTSWIQITERDNVTTRFWENYTHMISMMWPDVGERLREIGFPDTEEAFAKYATERKKTLSCPGKYFRVYDDFHLLQNPAVLKFFEQSMNNLPTNGTVILISRDMPDINITNLMFHERVFTLGEEEFRFTEDEIAKYFDQLRISATRQGIRDIYEDTQGWAFAVNLIGRSLGKDTKYEHYAIVAMRKNIFKLIQTETSQFVGSELWRFLLRISLIDHLASSLIKVLAGDDSLIKGLHKLNSYVRYDYHLGAYMIHHLFLDYLRQHQYMLSDEEKIDTYNKAAMWCEENDYMTDALSYYEKAGNHNAIIQIIYLLNLQKSPDMALFAMEIFNRIPKDVAMQNPLFPAMSIKIQMCFGQLKEANELAKQYSREYSKRPESPENNQALSGIYAAWAALRYIMSPFTHKYDFDVYYKKMREYYDKSPYYTYGPATKQPVGAYALLVGTNRAGAPEEYIGALTRSIPHTSYMQNGNLFGLDVLARGELCFYQRDMCCAEQYVNLALERARSKEQYDTQNRAIQYLMFIAFSRGDLGAATNLLGQAEAMLDIKEYTNRFEAYDITRSHFFLTLGQPEKLPDWLKSDFVKYAHPAFLESYANRVRAQYHYQTRQYGALLAFIESARENHTLLLGKIIYKVLEALSLYHLKRRADAIVALGEAYELAEPNRIVLPFTKHSKDMRTLTYAAMKDGKCTIPRSWLDDINRKSSAFARRLTHMGSLIMSAGDDDEKIAFTTRETQVLADLSQGLSRSEIAASQNLSVNTIKMVINGIYDKLCVTSVHDALRIAITQKVI